VATSVALKIPIVEAIIPPDRPASPSDFPRPWWRGKAAIDPRPFKETARGGGPWRSPSVRELLR
jgi:hypothetical protein